MRLIPDEHGTKTSLNKLILRTVIWAPRISARQIMSSSQVLHRQSVRGWQSSGECLHDQFDCQADLSTSIVASGPQKNEKARVLSTEWTEDHHPQWFPLRMLISPQSLDPLSGRCGRSRDHSSTSFILHAGHVIQRP